MSTQNKMMWVLMAAALLWLSPGQADVVNFSAENELNKLLKEKKGEVLLRKSCGYVCEEGVEKGYQCHRIIGGEPQQEGIGVASLGDDKTGISLLSGRSGNWATCCVGYRTCHDINGVLTIEDGANVVFKRMDFGDPIFSKDPEKVHVRQIRYKNCSKVDQNASENITLSANKLEAFNFQKSVTDSESIRVTARANFKWGIGSAGADVTYTIGHTVNVTNGKRQQFSETITRSSNIPVRVPPKSIVLLQAIMTENVATLPFTVELAANGKVVDNLTGIKWASDVLNEQDRALTIDGTLRAIGVSGLNVELMQQSVTKDDCPNDTEFTRESDVQYHIDEYIDKTSLK